MLDYHFPKGGPVRDEPLLQKAIEKHFNWSQGKVSKTMNKLFKGGMDEYQRWLPNPPNLRKIKTSKQKTMKGRPITAEEFKKMLDVTAKVVGEGAAESWKYVLRGLGESALRLDELMHVSWNKPGAIRPVWKDEQLPILEIPAAMQKNDTEESIPLLPWFESVLLETRPENRTGWVFDPQSLDLKRGRKVRPQRADAAWVGRIIARDREESGHRGRRSR